MLNFWFRTLKSAPSYPPLVVMTVVRDYTEVQTLPDIQLGKENDFSLCSFKQDKCFNSLQAGALSLTSKIVWR